MSAFTRLADACGVDLTPPPSVVRARCSIPDHPLARIDGSARRGDLGSVDDIDTADGLWWVDFGRGAIACTPEELTVVR